MVISFQGWETLETDCLARSKEGLRGGKVMKRTRVLSVFGTRPEAIKMAPLIKELDNRPDEFESIVVVTAQHREMLDQVLNIFNIEPDHDLNMMKKGQSIAQITTGALLGLEAVLKEEMPDIVLVHGDTSTTFAAALSAFYQQIPVGHVEAGLRTYDKYSPFPEEMNRQLTGVLTDLHFAPTEKAREYLLNENKPAETITVTGNTSIDAMKTTVRDDYSHPILEQYPHKKMILLTAHRRENIGENLEHIFYAIKKLVEKHQDIYVVYPVHLNPKVQKAARDILGEQPRIHLIEPLDVRNFHNLLSQAYLIMTDSGGIQEEAPSLGVPVLVLRGTTERPEGIEAGTLKLVGTNEENIYEQADLLLTNQEAYTIMAESKNPYGDGKASERIADELNNYFQVKRNK